LEKVKEGAMVKIEVIKTGNIATSLVLDLLLDERADRTDISVRTMGTGAKMTPTEVSGLVDEVVKHRPDVIIYVSPNPGAPGPKKVVKELIGKRAVVIGDAPGVKTAKLLEEKGLGYIFVLGDVMIGARREFLDPTEMSVFNAHMLKVLAVTGVIRLLQTELGKVVESVKKGSEYLPRIVVDADTALEYAGIKNPGAREKAREAYLTAVEAGKLNVKGCFMEKDPEKYIPMVARAHELIRRAADLADEAREIERKEDTLLRTPHYKDGRILRKRRLLDKPR
jgi:methylenetetrahydromethanopterin dehydrogenase